MTKRRELIDGKLLCSTCGELKPPEDYYIDKYAFTGKSSACKACILLTAQKKRDANPKTQEKRAREAESYQEYLLRWPARVAHNMRVSGLKRKYGTTLEWYDAKFLEQGGVCAICRKPETALGPKGVVRLLAVDHCHKGGGNRGLLCSRCNLAIGYMRDDPAILRAAAEYLERTAVTEA